MITPKEHFHGSDLEKIEKVYGIKKENITSFSGNVNPLGISFKLKSTLSSKIDAITGYPDREYTSLRQSISTYCGADFHHIMVGNGSTELISLFIQFIAPQKSLILAPTYSEYEREISLAGGKYDYYFLKEEKDFQLDVHDLISHLTSELDLLVICNPNNPTSSAMTKKELTSILEACRLNNIFCIIDETYVEFASNMEDITAVPLTSIFDNLIVLRGISKFFASPGLRLGYAICSNSKLLKEINERKNPWTINTLASIAGEIMFDDKEYITSTKHLIDTERTRIYNALLTCKNIKVFKPVANFILVKILKKGITSSDVFEAAIKEGLMIRDCSTFAGLDNTFIRFCFMSPEKNNELLQVLLTLLKD